MLRCYSIAVTHYKLLNKINWQCTAVAAVASYSHFCSDGILDTVHLFSLKQQC